MYNRRMQGRIVKNIINTRIYDLVRETPLVAGAAAVGGFGESGIFEAGGFAGDFFPSKFAARITR